MRRVTLAAEKIVGGGVALAHHDGLAWMVAGALPGETVVADEIRRRSGIVEARAVEVLAGPHPARVQHPCPHAKVCGGCDWPHVDPARDAGLKRQATAQAAGHHRELAARLAAAELHPSPLAYRLRARLHWDPESHRLGFYGARTWQVTPIPSCRILSPCLMGALPGLTEALSRSCAVRVDVEWLESLDGSTAVAALRCAREGPNDIDPDLVPDQAELGGSLSGFHVLTPSGRLLPGWGADTVTMALPIPLEVPMGAFFQSNRHLVPWLFGRVAELAGEPLPTWDLNAGAGFLAAAIHWADTRQGRHRELTMVEPYRPAAQAGARNLPQARVAVGRRAEAYLGRAGRLSRDALVLVDPPRAGLSSLARHRIAGWHPQRIIMLGCDPATWVRDAGFLLERGYRLAGLELVDLFPSTHHVEILATLEAG